MSAIFAIAFGITLVLVIESFLPPSGRDWLDDPF